MASSRARRLGPERELAGNHHASISKDYADLQVEFVGRWSFRDSHACTVWGLNVGFSTQPCAHRHGNAGAAWA